MTRSPSTRHASRIRQGLFALLSAASLLAFVPPSNADGIGLYARWLAEDIEGGGVIDRLQTTLEIRPEGAVSGSGGCNRFTGQAEISEQTISFGALAATRMMCPPASMDQEGKFFAALDKVSQWRIDQLTQKLTLLDDDDKALVVFALMD